MTYRIGEVATRVGVTRDTLRYYERLGVLPKARRTEGGLRTYGDDIVNRVRFIQQAQALGMTLKDVRQLLVDQGRAVGLIRFGRHLPYEGYDVQTDGRHSKAARQAPVH